MTKNDSVKRFDCIKMKTSIQKQIYDETKNMPIKELLRYFNGGGGSAAIKKPNCKHR
jgi:hypothetical protein